jgi:hypothetical protein
MKSNNSTIGIAILIAIGIAATATALQDPYPMDGYIVDKVGNTLSGANVTFTNQNTSEVIYDDSSASGWYSGDAGNFLSGYQNTHIIAYMVNYSGISYQNLSYSFVIDTAVGSNTVNITLDQAPTTPTGSSIAGTTNYTGDTLTVTGAGSTDADGDPVTYQYEFRRTSASGTVVQALSDTNTYTLQVVDAHDSIYVNVYGRGDGVNSHTYETENRAVTNSVPVLASIGSKSENENVQITVDADATDADTDTQTYSCNRTDLFSDFSTSTGLGHWTPSFDQAGIYYVDFGVSDGYGGTDNETITITVNDMSFDTDLFNGWNLLAWIADADGTAGEFAGIVTDAAYISEKNATTGNYVNFNPAAPAENNFTVIKGKGYYAQTTATSPFSRNKIDDVQYDTTLQSGWSIFGWTNSSSMTAAQVASDIGGNCQYLSTKNATTGNYVNFNPAAPAENNFDLAQGIAYYAKVSSETIWTREA